MVNITAAAVNTQILCFACSFNNNGKQNYKSSDSDLSCITIIQKGIITR